MKIFVIILTVLLSTCKEKVEESKVMKVKNTKSDTLIINLISKKIIDDVLEYSDEFGNNSLFYFGKNYMPKYRTIRDSHWQHDLYFPIPDSISKIDFVLENSFWYAKSKNEKMDKIINFEVEFRKTIDPIVKFEWSSNKFEDKKNKYWFKRPELREEMIKQYFMKKTFFLDSYIYSNQLDSSAYKLWLPIIKYQKIFYILSIHNYEKWDKNYLKLLTNLKSDYQDEEKLIFLPTYREGLSNLVGLMNYLENGNDWGLICQQKTIKQNFTGKHKDLLLLNLLIRCKDTLAGIKYSNVEYMQVLNDFINNCKIPEYITYIKKVTYLDNIVLKNNELINMQKQLKPFNKINNNQLTYIDFWASWCTPCREEMPSSKKLKDDYGNKGINFVYISIDENPAAWEKAMIQLGLSQKESYLLPKGNESLIAKQFKINSIPRYMIMDKSGNIINHNAPRPSDIKIKQIFHDLLNK